MFLILIYNNTISHGTVKQISALKTTNSCFSSPIHSGHAAFHSFYKTASFRSYNRQRPIHNNLCFGNKSPLIKTTCCKGFNTLSLLEFVLRVSHDKKSLNSALENRQKKERISSDKSSKGRLSGLSTDFYTHWTFRRA